MLLIFLFLSSHPCRRGSVVQKFKKWEPYLVSRAENAGKQQLGQTLSMLREKTRPFMDILAAGGRNGTYLLDWGKSR